MGEVISALYAPDGLKASNRVPPGGPTFLAVCAPTDGLRLIIVVCSRTSPSEAWTITGARDTIMNERAMWRKYTS